MYGATVLLMCGILFGGAGFMAMAQGQGAGIIFIALGAFMVYGAIYLYKEAIKTNTERKEIIENGKVYTVVILESYEGDPAELYAGKMIYVTKTNTGEGPTKLKVKTTGYDELEFDFFTGEYNKSKYPVGATLDIAVLNDKIAIIPKTIQY